jgi:hypothetical protein
VGRSSRHPRSPAIDGHIGNTVPELIDRLDADRSVICVLMLPDCRSPPFFCRSVAASALAVALKVTGEPVKPLAVATAVWAPDV